MREIFNLIVLISLACFGFCCISDAQIPPVLDNNWQLNPTLSDEFNGITIDNTKWAVGNYIYGIGCCSAKPFIPSFASENGGSLKLKADFIGNDLFTSGIETQNSNYLYGYYEIRAKLPGYFNPQTNLPCGNGFWTAFWTYNHTQSNGCITSHQEIDIVEPNGTNWNYENDAKTNEVGCWMWDGNCGDNKFGTKIIHDFPPLYENYHKFAAECLPDRIIYYFDDVPFNIVYNQPSYPTNPMKIAIGNQLAYHDNSEYNSNTPWPIFFEVDYFHYYELGYNCNSDVIINNNVELINFLFSVKRNITIGNGTTAISLNYGESKTFRAENGVLINGDFTVPIGSELNIIPTPCN